MSSVESSLNIYTIGHGNSTADHIVNLLKAQGIHTLVDVRSAPYSRYAPHFNRDSIQETLESAGFVYRYAGEYLGGRPKDPTVYRTGTALDEETDREDYLKLVDYDEVAKRDWYLKGIERLLAIAAEHPTAIMCSEEDPAQCHRTHLIARTLLERGVTVIHIRRSGALENAQLDPKQLTLF